MVFWMGLCFGQIGVGIGMIYDVKEEWEFLIGAAIDHIAGVAGLKYKGESVL